MLLLSSVQTVSPSTSADSRHKSRLVVALICLCVVMFTGSRGSFIVCVAGYIVLRCKLRFNLPVAAAKTLIGPTP